MRSGESYFNVDTLKINNLGLLNGLWYKIELSPLPMGKEKHSVIKTIINNEEVYLDDNFTVSAAKENNRLPKLGGKIKNVVSNLISRTFTVAIRNPVFDITKGSFDFGRLPIAVVLSEDITFNTFPFHPHLNHNYGEKMPSSICYTDNPKLLGEESKEIMINAIEQVSIWLVRHMFFEEYYKQYGKILWIGNQAPPVTDYSYLTTLDPFGECRCGSKIRYLDCCFGAHFVKKHKLIPNNNAISLYSGNWNKSREFEQKVLQILNT